MFIFFAIAFDPDSIVDKKIFYHFDKIKHILAFFVLSYFLFTSSVKIHHIFKFIILVFICFFIEYVQEMIGRQASLEDFLASFFGIVLFVILRIIVRRFFIR
jgi:VanZ family protein